jgi:hypothetical protein
MCPLGIADKTISALLENFPATLPEKKAIINESLSRGVTIARLASVFRKRAAIISNPATAIK